MGIHFSSFKTFNVVYLYLRNEMLLIQQNCMHIYLTWYVCIYDNMYKFCKHINWSEMNNNIKIFNCLLWKRIKSLFCFYPDFQIPISLHTNVVYLRYFKLWILAMSKKGLKYTVWSKVCELSRKNLWEFCQLLLAT